MTRPTPTPSRLFERAAHEAAGVVIGQYSTSFGMAVRLLQEPVRTAVRDVYAMVRVADEVVDGACAHLPGGQVEGLLDRYEQDVLAAIPRGFSTDLVIHAFALTARRVGIGEDLVAPFFSSMRADLTRSSHDRGSLEEYVHGSAEVVGLMCLRCFLHDRPDREEAWERLRPGAERLGAAFQKVNFLRDLSTDSEELGRTYFPGVTPDTLDEATKARLVDDIDADLRAADEVIALLPDSSRVAVRTAHLLFGELNGRIAATPARELARTRVRVPDARKAVLVARAFLMEDVSLPQLVGGRPSRPAPGGPR
ncbi:MAG: phytoene/squalene synthase family protein [Pauljensenia sp.]